MRAATVASDLYKPCACLQRHVALLCWGKSTQRRRAPVISGFPRPSHTERLILEGTVQDAAFVRFLERLGAEQLRSFSTHDFLTLDALRRALTLTPVQRSRLPELIAAGLVESHGRGRGVCALLSLKSLRKRGLVKGRKSALHVSASVAEAAHHKVDYIRNRGSRRYPHWVLANN